MPSAAVAARMIAIFRNMGQLRLAPLYRVRRGSLLTSRRVCCEPSLGGSGSFAKPAAISLAQCDGWEFPIGASFFPDRLRKD
jgi:hypothetical protein